jgi:hypothetical protein
MLHKCHSLCGENVAIATFLPYSRGWKRAARGKNVEKKFKNPHKIEFFHVFHIFILKMWSLKPLVYIAKVPFSPFPRF